MTFDEQNKRASRRITVMPSTMAAVRSATMLNIRRRPIARKKILLAGPLPQPQRHRAHVATSGSGLRAWTKAREFMRQTEWTIHVQITPDLGERNLTVKQAPRP